MKKLVKNEQVTLQFSLHPMADNFAAIIKDTLHEVDTSYVTMHTDDVGTTISGKLNEVFDVAKKMVIYSSKNGTHVAFNGTFSTDCPCGIGELKQPQNQQVQVNEETIGYLKQYVSSKFALYPLGHPDYMDVINKEIDRLKQTDLYNPNTIYDSSMHGDIQDVFGFLESSFSTVFSKLKCHLVMTLNMSVNSPSHK